MLKQKKKIIYAILLIVYLLNSFSGIVNAAQMNSADIVALGDCGYHLQFWDTNQNDWSYIITTMSGYYYNGELHYAYCMQSDRHGVGEAGNYTVNISDLLNDVQVWRTITAGFPYRTAAQLGCSTNEDAFVATKQAVYCIIYGFNPETRYRGGDARGEQIKQAMINLVNEGRNGTRTPSSANLKLNKVNDLTTDENYCYQEFSASSLVNISSYTVTAIPGLPEGTKIVNMNNNEQSTFNGNEHFKVQIPKNKIIENIEGKIIARAKCETFPIFYGQAPNSTYQDYALTFDPLGDEQGVAELNINAYNSSIKVIKQDSLTKYKIPGVVFNFKYENGENIGNFTTDKNGEITISKLKPGKIIAKELQTDKDYILDTTEKEIYLSYADTIIKSIDNDRKTGNLKIYKVDKDNKKVTLGNVEFDLYSHELDKVIGTYHTDANGEIYIKDLRVADYSIIEKATNKWYNLADDVDIKVEADIDNYVTIENELKKGQIRVIKVDQENHEVKLEGVKFGVYDKDNNLLETIVTNSEGEALTQEYVLRDFENLKLVELETKQEYVLNDKPQTIKLEENQIKNITFENKKIYGKVEITKVDSKTKKSIEGVTFGLFNSKNEQIGTLKTDKNGKAESSKLPYGKYYLKELDTGSPYYLLNEKTFKFEVKKDNQIIPVKIENDSTDITVEVDKKGTTEIKPGEMVNYEFSNVANKSNIYLDNFKWFDYIPTDYVRLQTMTTGTWNQDITYSVYYKTNKSEDYILRYENLKTTENHTLDFTKEIELAEDEYITETMFDFGKVEIGFQEDVKPTMTCKSFDTLKNGQTFTNKTRTVGTYFDLKSEANSKWTTIVHKPEEQKQKVLPKTGK
ncbi:MAG: Cys-Gln thioester bond-forming surface protein [Clostridia bacterium]|nr:Cys-Gln thioester bond-forming surface protein [Clostridia bacterium]MBP3800943.1 Cys-Gln thioester bond-forming surface protein [Clostridia bacterium]